MLGASAFVSLSIPSRLLLLRDQLVSLSSQQLAVGRVAVSGALIIVVLASIKCTIRLSAIPRNIAAHPSMKVQLTKRRPGNSDDLKTAFSKDDCAPQRYGNTPRISYARLNLDRSEDFRF